VYDNIQGGQGIFRFWERGGIKTTIRTTTKKAIIISMDRVILIHSNLANKFEPAMHNFSKLTVPPSDPVVLDGSGCQGFPSKWTVQSDFICGIWTLL